MQRKFFFSNPANMKTGLDDQVQRTKRSTTSCKVYLGEMGAGVNTNPPAAPTRMMEFIRRGLFPEEY
jgi:hypothetical protein